MVIQSAIFTIIADFTIVTVNVPLIDSKMLVCQSFEPDNGTAARFF